MAKDKSQPGRSRVTLIYDTGEREDDALEQLRWVVPAVFLAATLILFFAVLEWVAPLTPVLLFLGAVLMPLGGFVIWHTRGAGPVDQAAAVGLLAIFGLPLLAWAAEPYRMAVIWAAGDLLPVEAMVVAAEDKGDGVASRACRRVLSSEVPERLERIGPILEARPQVAAACLENLEESQRGELVRISRHLRQTWYGRWMSDGEAGDEERICTETAIYPRLAELHGAQGTPDLLLCALGSPNESAAQCCAQVVSEQTDEQRRLVLDPYRWGKPLRENLFFELAEAVDLPAADLLSDHPVDENLRWSAGELFHWNSHLGCHLMREHEARDSIARRLSSTIETQCGLAVDDPLFSSAAVDFVNQTCTMALSPQRSGQVDIVQWCDAAREANRQTALASAKFVVRKALARQGVDELERSILRGAARSERRAQGRPVYEVSRTVRGRADDDIGTDGVRMRRPVWADHTPESQARLRAMEEERERRREEIHRNADRELSTAEIDSRITEDIREELRRLRDEGER